MSFTLPFLSRVPPSVRLLAVPPISPFSSLYFPILCHGAAPFETEGVSLGVGMKIKLAKLDDLFRKDSTLVTMGPIHL